MKKANGDWAGNCLATFFTEDGIRDGLAVISNVALEVLPAVGGPIDAGVVDDVVNLPRAEPQRQRWRKRFLGQNFRRLLRAGISDARCADVRKSPGIAKQLDTLSVVTKAR